MNDLPSYSHGFSVTGGVRETIPESLREIWRFRPLIAELVRRDLKVRYKNRVGGVLWSLFPPLLQVFTITIMVKLFLGQVPNYSAYLLPVLFLWQFFQNCVLDASQSMIVNAPLARKIYFPRAVLPLVTLISNLMHFGVSFIFTVVYFFIVPISDPIFPKNLHLNFFLVFPVLVGVSVLALGIGYLLAYVNTIYDDVRFLTTQMLGLFLYALPIFYPIEKVATHQRVFEFYMCNPMATWMVAYQRAMLPPIQGQGVAPVEIPWAFLGLATLTSLIIMGWGFTVFERSKWTMMERL